MRCLIISIKNYSSCHIILYFIYIIINLKKSHYSIKCSFNCVLNLIFYITFYLYKMKWLIFGGKGWIGQYVSEYLDKLNEEIIHSKNRVDDEVNVEKEIIEVKPDRIIYLIGKTSETGFNN